jgi:hypothetical protein
MIPFEPRAQGEVVLAAAPADLFERLERRIRAGLFGPGAARANYRVLLRQEGVIRFRAADLPTALGMGLNDVAIVASGARLRWVVEFATWSFFCLSTCASIALLLAVAYFFVAPVRASVDRTPGGGSLFWAILAFWGLAWPGVLTWLHKRPIRRVMESLIRDCAAG